MTHAPLRPAATGIHCPHCHAVAAAYDRGSAAGVRRVGAAGGVRIHGGRTVVTCGRCGKDFDPHERRAAPSRADRRQVARSRAEFARGEYEDAAELLRRAEAGKPL